MICYSKGSKTCINREVPAILGVKAAEFAATNPILSVFPVGKFLLIQANYTLFTFATLRVKDALKFKIWKEPEIPAKLLVRKGFNLLSTKIQQPKELQIHGI